MENIAKYIHVKNVAIKVMLSQTLKNINIITKIYGKPNFTITVQNPGKSKTF